MVYRVSRGTFFSLITTRVRENLTLHQTRPDQRTNHKTLHHSLSLSLSRSSSSWILTLVSSISTGEDDRTTSKFATSRLFIGESVSEIFPMDPSRLAVIIAAAACSPNPNDRKAAEQSLDQVNSTFILL